METVCLSCLVFDQKEQKAFIADTNQLISLSLPDPTVLLLASTCCSISLISIISSSSIIIYCGSIMNSFYPPTKAVFYDMKSEKDIYSTSFQKPIVAITSINKYVFLEVKGNELNVLKYENEKSIDFIEKISLTDSTLFTAYFLIWFKSNNDIIRYNIAYATDNNDVGVIQYFDYLFIPYTKGNNSISATIKSFQNFFYDSELDSLFIVENQGKRIEEVIDYNTPNYKIVRKYFRGPRSGYITDIRSLRKDYVAIANYDKTILIFFNGEENVSVASLMIGIINQGILCCIKINLKEINPLDSNQQEDLPQKKNEMRLLVNNERGNELYCYDSSWFYYSIKIDYLRKIYSLIHKRTFWRKKIHC